MTVLLLHLCTNAHWSGGRVYGELVQVVPARVLVETGIRVVI